MKVQIISEEVATEVAQTTGKNEDFLYEVRENTDGWMDEDGKTYAFELILLQSERLTWGWWVHADEVRLLTPSEELAALGYPGYSDEFAEEALLYMVENDVAVELAVTIVQAKNLTEEP